MITESLKTALSSAFTQVSDDVVAIIGVATPAALSIIGVALAVTLGIKMFKKLTGQA